VLICSRPSLIAIFGEQTAVSGRLALIFASVVVTLIPEMMPTPFQVLAAPS
jgi:hypothetical protein